ncbi:MAG: hypothetical protein GWM90_11290 [Gemmatimonadetes bacterium]|nr:hypothetical protein [Gemmatimonadota bacterium]NIQ54568.1 hypothetical protein [Gemmatimonadota bacterium]NIU74771.1 hypothetical protein [Gammaproteobacteria bacterium]NIX44677.1 hypothetical protein [Gemmatimonadota bacterium]NIY08912.1 hypothetical protein [Gemmatimonadota bacterium]
MLMMIVALALTAVIAGLVPTLLFFATAADRKVLVVGGLGVVGSYMVVLWAGVPGILLMNVNGLNIFPVWALIVAFPVALVWKLVAGASRPPPTEEERLAAIREKARAKARTYEQDGG